MKISDMRKEKAQEKLEAGDVITQKQGVWMIVKMSTGDFGLVNLRNGFVSVGYKTLSDLEKTLTDDELVDAELIIK